MTRKERLQAEASALGLSAVGTMAQLQARIDAALEAAEDTATAAYAKPASHLKSPSIQKRHHLDPVHAALAGTAIAATFGFFH